MKCPTPCCWEVDKFDWPTALHPRKIEREKPEPFFARSLESPFLPIACLSTTTKGRPESDGYVMFKRRVRLLRVVSPRSTKWGKASKGLSFNTQHNIPLPVCG